jgi:hypothetical protein
MNASRSTVQMYAFVWPEGGKQLSMARAACLPL